MSRLSTGALQLTSSFFVEQDHAMSATDTGENAVTVEQVYLIKRLRTTRLIMKTIRYLGDNCGGRRHSWRSTGKIW